MRVVLASLCLIAFAAPALAQQQPATPSVLDQVYACANVNEEAARLSCYDTAVGRLREAQSSGNIVAVDRGQMETIERESFGFALPSLPTIFRRDPTQEQEAIREARFTIERVSRHADGRSTFYMTDGAAWTQIESESARNARPGENVTVRRASLGSFMMSFESGGRAQRVRRVQ